MLGASESSNRGQKDKAFEAMTKLKFKWMDIYHALEDILPLYNYSWDLIEEYNYYGLINRLLKCSDHTYATHQASNGDVHKIEELPEPTDGEPLRSQKFQSLLMENSVQEAWPTQHQSESSKGQLINSDTFESPLQRFRKPFPTLLPLEKIPQMSNSTDEIVEKKVQKNEKTPMNIDLNLRDVEVFSKRPQLVDEDEEFSFKRAKLVDEEEEVSYKHAKLVHQDEKVFSEVEEFVKKSFVSPELESISSSVGKRPDWGSSREPSSRDSRGGRPPGSSRGGRPRVKPVPFYTVYPDFK